jgi:endonuclease/exonuclease/phosphatase family metal-dependent hydrolase
VAFLVRTWNVFHGNTSPPHRRTHLRPMVELAVADEPDVVCLQEVPVWALRRLAGWSGYRAFGAVARGGVRPARVSGWVTRRHQGLLRSAVSGQANAVLVHTRHRSSGLDTIRVSGPGREPRVAQSVRVAGLGVVVNLHASQRDEPAALAEIERAVAFARRRLAEGEALVLAGDLNLTPELEGFSEPGPGIDHVLVSGRKAGLLSVWNVERRVQNGRVLSDHAPVDLVIP